MRARRLLRRRSTRVGAGTPRRRAHPGRSARRGSATPRCRGAAASSHAVAAAPLALADREGSARAPRPRRRRPPAAGGRTRAGRGVPVRPSGRTRRCIGRTSSALVLARRGRRAQARATAGRNRLQRATVRPSVRRARHHRVRPRVGVTGSRAPARYAWRLPESGQCVCRRWGPRELRSPRCCWPSPSRRGPARRRRPVRRAAGRDPAAQQVPRRPCGPRSSRRAGSRSRPTAPRSRRGSSTTARQREGLRVRGRLPGRRDARLQGHPGHLVQRALLEERDRRAKAVRLRHQRARLQLEAHDQGLVLLELLQRQPVARHGEGQRRHRPPLARRAQDVPLRRRQGLPRPQLHQEPDPPHPAAARLRDARPRDRRARGQADRRDRRRHPERAVHREPAAAPTASRSPSSTRRPSTTRSCSGKGTPSRPAWTPPSRRCRRRASWPRSRRGTCRSTTRSPSSSRERGRDAARPPPYTERHGQGCGAGVLARRHGRGPGPRGHRRARGEPVPRRAPLLGSAAPRPHQQLDLHAARPVRAARDPRARHPRGRAVDGRARHGGVRPVPAPERHGVRARRGGAHHRAARRRLRHDRSQPRLRDPRRDADLQLRGHHEGRAPDRRGRALPRGQPRPDGSLARGDPPRDRVGGRSSSATRPARRRTSWASPTPSWCARG